MKWLSLDKIAFREFDYKMQSYDEITNKKEITFDEVGLEYASVYSWEDVYITYKIFDKQKQEKITNNKVLQEIEIPLIRVLKNMEINWVKIDRDRLKWIWILLEKEIKISKKEIFEESQEEFNINSPKQVWEILFDKLKLPKWKKTKTWYSVSVEVLKQLSYKFDIAQKIINYRHYSKILSTYINWLIILLDENDFLHTSYNQFVTSTWRLSSTKPNLQNIPMWDWIAWEVRDAFISRFYDKKTRKNWKIMTFDYSQVEIRLLAIMSGDKNLINAFKNGIDIHQNTQELIWSKDRKTAKAVNFWVIYWISWFWLSKMVDLRVKEATEYINKFFDSYPRVKDFLKKIVNDCEKKWYVETMFWRKRFIKWITDSNKTIKKQAEREAINMPIQWTSADIIKIAMIKIDKFLNTKKLKSKLIMQVHDELVFDVFFWEEEKIEKEVKDIMENIIQDKFVKLKVDIHKWESWKK
jgi:DNA polymerase I